MNIRQKHKELVDRLAQVYEVLEEFRLLQQAYRQEGRRSGVAADLAAIREKLLRLSSCLILGAACGLLEEMEDPVSEGKDVEKLLMEFLLEGSKPFIDVSCLEGEDDQVAHIGWRVKELWDLLFEEEERIEELRKLSKV